MSVATIVRREPVRVYLYGVAVAVLAVLVMLDIVDKADIPVWGVLVSAILAIPVVEGTRSQVTPVNK